MAKETYEQLMKELGDCMAHAMNVGLRLRDAVDGIDDIEFGVSLIGKNDELYGAIRDNAISYVVHEMDEEKLRYLKEAKQKD